jgi:predicted dehydrogenase
MKGKVRVAVAGLRFGSVFPAIYMDHPDVEYVGICDVNPKVLKECGDRFGIGRRHENLRDVIESRDYDAVHLITPIPFHEEQAVTVLKSGKHCACTVPAATTLEGLRRIVRAERESGRNYMMMETAVYTRQFLYAKELLREGRIGRIQFLRGAHYQDMEGWPDYWRGLPPMHYATHAISPLLCIAGTRAETVHCFGSGAMRDELKVLYGNPYPVETAIFRLEGEALCAEATRSLFHTARDYLESFNVYGEKGTFEWFMEKEAPVFHEADRVADRWGEEREITARRLEIPDFAGMLPPEIAHHTRERVVLDPEHPDRAYVQGGGHHGSHPHLVHEFVRSIVEGRPSAIGAVTAADWTAAGVCAHQSALQGGGEVAVPSFRTR